MKSVGSHGGLSLLFVMKVMVWNFVSIRLQLCSFSCCLHCFVMGIPLVS
jgi:hypothetical protein